MLSNVLDTKGKGVDVFGFWGTKTRLWVHYKVKININSSSQYVRLQYTRGGRGGPFLLTPRGRGYPPPMIGTFSKCWYKTQVFRALKCLNSHNFA